MSAAQGTLEYRGRLATLGLTLANTDVIGESGIVVTQLLRRITPRLDLGAELVYQYGKQIPGSQISVLSYAARYATPSCSMLAICAFLFVTSPGVSVAAEPNTSLASVSRRED